jgi:rRNA processing protein Krr1/Pno1
MKDHDIPINVIILEDIKPEYESLIDSYVEIIKTCKKVSELRSALEMIVEESRELTIREIFVRHIQHLAEMIDDSKNF